MHQKFQISETYQKDIHRAIEIVKEAGCSEIFLFGSLVSGEVGDKSDIDLAIRGCPQGKFFHLLGKLLLELDYPVDLVNLDRQNAFAQYLEKAGELIPID
ncbi:MAG: nucleotidyltransferase family protein [bacterium]